MTLLNLMLWIAAGAVLQIASFLCLSFWRHWQSYRALKTSVSALDIAVSTEAGPRVLPQAAAAWSGLRAFEIERKVWEDTQRQVCSFYLVPKDGEPLPPFLPGQFLTFSLNVPTPSGASRSVVRCYSLSDAPHPRRYRISVKRAPAPCDSALPEGIASNFLHDHVEVGSVLQVRAPAGHFYIDRSDAPVVLIGGGIGITPMLSMLEWCVAEQPGRELWLFYGVRNGSECIQLAHLTELASQHPNFHLHLCLSDVTLPDPLQQNVAVVHQHHVRVDVALLRRVLPLKPYHYYICGPTPMLQSLVPALEDWGVASGRIHFEAFGPASIPRKNQGSAAQATITIGDPTRAVVVTFAKSGRQETWKPGMGSLLDFAEARGIALDSGCRAGGCGSCQTSIRTGEVAYLQVPEFDPEPGSCLLCVCTPKTDITLEA